MFSALSGVIPPELVQTAIEAGRTALRRLDDDDVPAKLRKVAAHQGGRLPVPLSKALIAALDDDEWLREKAIEELEVDDPAAEGPAGAAALFLLRPEGWEFELGRRVERLAQTKASGRVSELDGLVAEAKAREAEAKKRWQAAKRQIKDLERLRREEVEAVRAQLRELREADRIEDEEHARLVGELEEARSRAEAAHQKEIAAGETLKARLRKAENLRADVEKRVQSGGTAWGSGDPIALARHLDTLVRTVEADPALLEFTKPTRERAWKLPPGARPDDRNAVDWLARQPRPFTLLVDGYNVTFRLSGGPDAAARERLNEELSRFKLRAKTPVNVVVVYDSAISPEVETGAGPGGIWLRYTKLGLTADDEIRRLAAETVEPLAVVSSDREVREGSEQFGAIVIWSEALVAWIQGR
ncbi:MAG: NYN domain-containing protein [Acidimicrobiia bacterium]|nr:NYN domain-containing protein [Acidimicrobiia bacterium]